MENSYDFDLQKLLNIEKLNVRKLAKDKPNLFAKDYFKLLVRFIEEGKSIPEILKKISSMNTEERDLKNIAFIKVLLKDIGQDSFSSVIDEIISLVRKGQDRDAIQPAEKLLEEYLGLYEMILKARKPETSIRKFLSALIDEVDHKK